MRAIFNLIVPPLMGQKLVQLPDNPEKIRPQLLPDGRIETHPDIPVENSQGTLSAEVQQFQLHLVEVQVPVDLLAAGEVVCLERSETLN